MDDGFVVLMIALGDVNITAVCLAIYNIRIHRCSGIDEYDEINARLIFLLCSAFKTLRMKTSQPVIHFIDVGARLETRRHASLMREDFSGV